VQDLVHVGFTGTRVGMTEAQEMALEREILDLPEEFVFHHGDCIGADEEAHVLVRRHRPRAKVHIHPPIKTDYRAGCDYDRIEPPLGYIPRNHNIVDAVTLRMFATPGEYTEQRRGSGTWATVRYARKRCKDLIMVMPKGERVRD
jgi:hypothetical protein